MPRIVEAPYVTDMSSEDENLECARHSMSLGHQIFQDLEQPPEVGGADAEDQ